jgi:hypothetical protein
MLFGARECETAHVGGAETLYPACWDWYRDS